MIVCYLIYLDHTAFTTETVANDAKSSKMTMIVNSGDK